MRCFGDAVSDIADFILQAEVYAALSGNSRLQCVPVCHHAVVAMMTDPVRRSRHREVTRRAMVFYGIKREIFINAFMDQYD